MRFKTINIVLVIALVLLVAWDWTNIVSPYVYVALAVAYLLLVFYGTVTVSAQFFTPIRCMGSPQSNAIAITFDDGPVPGKTERILDVLRKFQIKAAFFCIGNRVEKHLDLANKIHREGHLVSNHSYHHAPTFDLQSAARMHSELEATDKAIHKVVGETPRFFRPPYGVTNPNLAKAIQWGNYITVGWSVRSFDTVIKNKSSLFKRVTRNLKAGDIVLFHDYCDSTIEILPEFIQHVQKIGLKIVRVDELLKESAYA